MEFTHEQEEVFSFLTVSYMQNFENNRLNITELINLIIGDVKSPVFWSWYRMGDINKAEVVYHTAEYMIQVMKAKENGYEPPIPYTIPKKG